MSWRDEFKHALIWEIVRSGQFVRDDASYYGWADYDWEGTRRKLLLGAEVDYEATNWEESSWDEFQGTFYEGDTRKYGIDMNLVLKDGTVHKMRWSGSVGSLILALVKETDDFKWMNT